MNRLFILCFIISQIVFAQQCNTSGLQNEDTSFTNYSAALKVNKTYPEARVAEILFSDSLIFLSDITYASYGKRILKLDIISPVDTNYLKLFPAVIFVHGGGWRSGNKSQERALAQRISLKGYVSLLVDYRLSTEALYPAAVLDLKKAIRWIRANANRYNIDPNKIAILGCSSGGHLSTLVGTTSGVKKLTDTLDYNEYSDSVSAIINIDGIVDFTNSESKENSHDPIKPSSAALWLGGTFEEKPDLWKEASPIFYVSPSTPPVIFINSSLERFHAGRDNMIKILRSFNIYYEVYTISDSPHPFWLFYPWFDKTSTYILNFLNKILKNN
ncbi:MAG: alpha/beta hydrolase [Bacteroidota bacterium]|nr:alpha/beta hydrolase [Bacteroidota bacterium]MDP4190541.1 alpha/beta hydrolase [Bacteroidota bacterium]MDP4193656.1 alpha/beta hydrolase [Bacteroidota bacterium]